MNWKTRVRILLAGIYLATLITSCASPPSPPERVPEWIGQPTRSEGEEVRLVAFGRDVDTRSADRSAVDDAVDQLLVYAERFSEGQLRLLDRRSLAESWRSRLQVQLSDGPDRGYSPADHGVAIAIAGTYHRRSAVTVETYLLILADFSKFAPERVRERPAPEEPETSDPVPEQPGPEPPTEPRTEPERPPRPPAIRFTESIESAADPTLQLEDREAAWSQALSLASEVQVVARTVEIGLLNGRPADQQVDLVVAEGLGTITISYPARMVDQSTDVVRELSIPDPPADATDTTTITVSDTPPVPRLVGTYQATVQPAWWPQFRRSILDSELSTAQVGVSELGSRLTTEVTIRVDSIARTVPTAIALLETDIAGNPLDSNQATLGLLGGLRDGGFRASEASLPSQAIDEVSQPEGLEPARLYDLLSFETLTDNERAIVGLAGISNFSEEDGFQVEVEVRVAVFDLRRDALLIDATIRANSQGNSSQAAIRAAMRHAGRQMANYLIPRLP